MPVRRVSTGVMSVGAIDWHRKIFDELIPLPRGTSYNSYLVRGSEKTALIDTVDPSKESEFISNLEKQNPLRIDYIISNHAEQDHSGAIPRILQIYPDAKVVTNARCMEMLTDLLDIDSGRFLLIKDRERLSLGDRTLEFIMAPWVHWPETMFTFLIEDRILFSCDFLGSHFASGKLFAEDDEGVYEGAKRYHAEIMMPFRAGIRRHIETIRGLDVRLIAPSHGLVYAEPERILEECSRWASEEVRNEAVIVYVSMHGSTERMVAHLTGHLIEKGIHVRPFNLTVTDLGELAVSLIDAATIIIASPTILSGPHPAVVHAASLVSALRPKLRFAAVIGSYGWGGKTVDTISSMLGTLNIEMLEPVMVKGYPKHGSLERLDRLADEIVKRHKTL